MEDQIRTMVEQQLESHAQRIAEMEAQNQRIAEMMTKLDELTKKRSLEVNKEVPSNPNRNSFKFLPNLEFPSFDGVNPRDWVRKCSKYFSLNKIPESQRVEVASIHLTGRAAAWFASYSAVRKNLDWCDFILDICNCFKDKLGSQVIGDCHKLHQSGFASLMLHKSPELSNDSFIASFGEGLKTHLKPFVEALNHLALDDATPFARPQEDAAAALKMHQKVPTPEPPPLSAPRAGAGNTSLSDSLTYFKETASGSNTGVTSSGSSATCVAKPFNQQFTPPQIISAAERAEKITKGLCYFDNYPYKRGHQYPVKKSHLFLEEVPAECDDDEVDLWARFRNDKGTQSEAAVKLDALQMLDESPKRGPLLVFMEAGGEFLFIAFDPGGLSFLPTKSSRCIGRCPFALEFVLDVDELGLRVIEPVAATVVFDPGGISHNNDELGMRAVEPVAALAWRLKKGIWSCRRFLLLRRWKRSSSSAYSQSAGLFTEVSVKKGGIALIYELGMFAVEPGPVSQRMVAKFLEAMVEKAAMEKGANWESKGIVTRRPLVLHLHKTEEGSEAYAEFLHPPKHWVTDWVTGKTIQISPIPIHFSIYSPNVFNLTLIDLLSLTKVAVKGQPESIVQDMEDMVRTYAEKPNCIILAISPADRGMETFDALKLTREVDPSSDRALGVLTKLVLMEKGTNVLDVLEGRAYILHHPWVGIVNRSQAEINRNVDTMAVRRKEHEHSAPSPDYSHLASRMGSAYFTNAKLLSKHLESVVRGRIPSITSLINTIIDELEDRLGRPVGVDASAQLYTILELCCASDIVFKEHLYGVFDNQLPAALRKLPFDRYLSLPNVKKVVSEADGYQPQLLSPEPGYRCLIDGTLNYFKGPGEASADAVHFAAAIVIDEPSMRAVESVAALTWRLGKKGIRSCRRGCLMLKSWRSSSSAHVQVAAPFSQSTAQKGGCFLYGGRKPDTGNS